MGSQFFLEQGAPLETFGVPSPESLTGFPKAYKISINKQPSTQFLSVQHHVSSCIYNHHLFCEWVRKLRLKKNNIVKQLLHYVAKEYAVLPVSTVKCLYSGRGNEGGKEGSHSH